MDRPGRRSLRVAGVAFAASTFLAATAAGATTKISIALQGGTPGAAGQSCGVSPHWSYYMVGGTVRFSGRVSPAPKAGTPVKIVVRRCFAPRFTVVKTQTARARGGAYSGSFVVHTQSDCYVQATVGGRKSPRAYFRVR